MTRDAEVEAALRRVRAADPDPALRVRALAAARRGAAAPARWWVAAAVALAALAAGWTLLPAPLPDLDGMGPERRQAVEATAAMFGGGPDALRYADLVIPPPDDQPLPLEPPEVP